MTVTHARQDDETAFASTEPAPGRLRVRRQPKWIAAGVLALCLGGLGATVLYATAAESTDVIVMTRTVPRGQMIQADDLVTTRVGNLAGVSYTDATQRGALVGQRALVDLAQGSLLPAGAVGTPELLPGSTQLGLRLAPGRIPADELPAGTPVLLVPLADARLAPDEKPASPAPAPQPIRATVLLPPRPGPDGVAMLLDVRVEAGRAAEVASLAADERIALVREAHS